MAYPKKKRAPEGPDEVRALKEAIASDQLLPLYVFYGEETYLRDHYLSQMKTLLCGDLPEMNCEQFEGKGATPAAIREAAETFPAFGGRRLVIVRDCDILRATGDMAAMAEETFPNLTPETVLVFIYDTGELKTPEKKMSQLVHTYGKVVEFRRADLPALERWVAGHFRALGKECGQSEASYLIYRCGGLMNDLLPQIQKVGHYCEGDRVTRSDIETMCTPSVDAAVFDLTDAVSARSVGKALGVLGDLLATGEDPNGLITLLSNHMRQLYAARILLEQGKGEEDLMRFAKVSHPYVAKKLMSAARGVDLAWTRRACIACTETERGLRSSAGDRDRLMERLIFTIIGVGD